jgi:hypothetical protein
MRCDAMCPVNRRWRGRDLSKVTTAPTMAAATLFLYGVTPGMVWVRALRRTIIPFHDVNEERFHCRMSRNPLRRGAVGNVALSQRFQEFPSLSAMSQGDAGVCFSNGRGTSWPAPNGGTARALFPPTGNPETPGYAQHGIVDGLIKTSSPWSPSFWPPSVAMMDEMGRPPAEPFCRDPVAPVRFETFFFLSLTATVTAPGVAWCCSEQ